MAGQNKERQNKFSKEHDVSAKNTYSNYSIKQLSKIFLSNSKAQEILLLLAGVKPVVRQGFYEHELPQVTKFCNENSIFLVKSKFKIEITDKDKEYSNKGARINIDDSRKGMFFVYLSMDEMSSYLAAYAEQINDHKQLGLLLGYPDCCIDFFCKNFSEHNPNLELKPANPYTNLSKRGKDFALLSHFPCSSECKKSIILAKKYLEAIKKADNTHAERLMNELGEF